MLHNTYSFTLNYVRYLPIPQHRTSHPTKMHTPIFSSFFHLPPLTRF